MTGKARIRRDIQTMSAYTPTTSLDVFAERLGMALGDLVKLDANENPFGPSPRVVQALANLPHIGVYPDPESGNLRELLSAYTGVDAGQILCGAGADELIEIILQLFIEPGDTVVNTPPTFAMYGFDAPLYHARVIDAPRDENFALDVAGIESAVARHKAKLVFVCSPNNPSGNLIAAADLERLIALPCVVAVDEAYIEFAESESLVQRAAESDNLIVLRTLSKWAGLAGLRIGYGIFPRHLMPHLWKIKQPYNINLAADIAAQASLRDVDCLQERVQQLIQTRKLMQCAFAELPFLQPYPSRANFVLNQVRGMSAAELRDKLAERGIIVRYYDKPGLRDHIRVSAGTSEQMGRLMHALHAIAP